jgi:hypothetical protein
MLSISLARRGGLAGMVSGILWIVLGLSTILLHLNYLAPATIYDYLASAFYSLALFGLVGPVMALHALQAKRTKEIGVFFFFVACIGAILTGLGNIAVGWLHLSFAEGWVYTPGFLALLFGLILFALTTLVAGILPPWYSWVIAVSLLGLFLAAIGGSILVGIIWFVIAYFLWSGRTIRSLLPEAGSTR